MKQQQIRIRLMTLVLAAVAGASVAATATAAGVGGGAHVGAGTTMPGAAQAGGSADSHLSTSGSANTNAQWQNGAVRGADRADERKNAKGAELPQSDGADLEADTATTTKGKSKP